MPTPIAITLRNFTHNARLSEETYCFSATVCIDGNPAFGVSNRGCGGGDEYHPVQPGPGAYDQMRAAVQRVEEYAATLPPETHFGMTIQPEAETVIANLVTAKLDEREKAKFAKKMSTAIYMLEGGKVYSLAMRDKKLVTAEAIAKATAKYPSALILNSIPLDEAFAKAFPKPTE